MKRTGYRIALLLGGLLIPVNSMSPAFAQEQEKKEVKQEVTVKVDEDGNVTINGEPAGAGETILPDGTRVIVDEGGRAIIIDDDGEKNVIRRRMLGSAWDDDDENVVIIERDDDGEKKTVTRRIRVPEPHGLMEWHHAPGAFDEARVWGMRPGNPMFFDRDFEFDFDFDFRHSSPEIVKMEAESRELARKIKDAEGQERSELEQELSEKLRDIFDKKLEVRQERIEKLQKRLGEQRAELQERQQSRSEIIERRKAELLGEDKLEW